MDLAYLNDKIRDIGISKTVIAEKMGISRQTLHIKLEGQRDFKSTEVNMLCDVLRLTDEEKEHIFFAN